MSNYSYGGFMYENDEELRGAISIDEYLDRTHGKNVNSRNERGVGGEDYKWQEEDESTIDFSYSLSDDLYCVRKAHVMTQKEFAKKLGVGVATVAKIESGNMNVRKKTLAIIQLFLEKE